MLPSFGGPVTPRHLAIAAAILVVAVLGYRFAPTADQVVHAVAWMQELGPTGWLVFSVVFLAWTLFALPASWSQGTAGFLFGPVVGFFVASALSTATGTVAFLLARTRLRSVIADRISGDPRFRAIDSAIGDGGTQLVVVLRLSPLSPFNVVNYALGITRVPLRSYVIGTLVGSIPPVLLYSYLGSTVGDLSRLLDGSAAAETGWAQGLALGTTLLATALVTRFAQVALKRSLPSPDGVTA
ncbi:MAG: putative membrane protein YdjX (TVP38/TMEM64 family) [Myxococcota bacterium]|jgi:uncharacterized membrane protein YdjX (TVP38/TMEM64 family)